MTAPNGQRMTDAAVAMDAWLAWCQYAFQRPHPNQDESLRLFREAERLKWAYYAKWGQR